MGDKGAALLPAALHVLGSSFSGGGGLLLRPTGTQALGPGFIGVWKRDGSGGM